MPSTSAQPVSNGNSEVVSIDAVIDRLVIRHQRIAGPNLDRVQMIDAIVEHISFVFAKNIGRTYVSGRLRRIIDHKKQLEILLNLPKIDQRTPAWYEARNNLITASDFAQCLGYGKFGTPKQFYEKKCGYQADKFDASLPALRWGIMFEPVAASAYVLKNEGLVLHDFGLLKHPHISHLGASPDGISELGVMLEIKCPWRRKISGEIPLQYYYQMQGQLDVCGLDECDYLECGFSEYGDSSDFKSNFHSNDNFKGIIVELASVDEGGDITTRYEYVDEAAWGDLDKQMSWFEGVVQGAHNTKDTSVVGTTFWQLHTYSVRRVYRDDGFIGAMCPRLSEVWQNVESFKSDKQRYDFYMHGTSVNTCAAKKELVSIDTASSAKKAPGVPPKNLSKNLFGSYAFVEEEAVDEHKQVNAYAFVDEDED